jgi:NAD(P)-dependent dehydrogenase (short-subunit alcohol dehydrogenase family)
MPITSPFHARSTALDVVSGLDLTGRSAIVTGGGAGIGLETARALASAGARVTLAVRNAEQGRASAERLRAETGNPAIDVGTLDLADLPGVRRFAASWSDRPLHLLVNNAGVMACPLARTPQGWESQFATNHLGHFALTTALLPALKAAGNARVVTLSSMGHKLAGIDFDDLHFERREYNKWKAYGQAKSANALMSLGLHARHAADGITSLAVHPGGVDTDLHRHVPDDEKRAMGWVGDDGRISSRFKTPAQGAATSVWAATAPALEGQGGLYLEDCQEGLPAEPGNRTSGHAPHIMDKAVADRLWRVSEMLLASV